jgi:hypothetical protein
MVQGLCAHLGLHESMSRIALAISHSSFGKKSVPVDKENLGKFIKISQIIDMLMKSWKCQSNVAHEIFDLAQPYLFIVYVQCKF